MATFKVPDAGFYLELTEFTGVDRKPGIPRNQDPGAATFVLTVRDLDKAPAVTWEFVDYKTVDRKPFELHVPDPGSSAFSLRVKDADALVSAVKAAGGSVVSTGGPLGATAGSIFVRGPNGFLIELIQSP